MSKSNDIKVGRTLIDTIREMKKPTPIPASGWLSVGASAPEVPFENGWENAGNVDGFTNADAQWYLSDGGEVRLRGKIKNGLYEVPAFTLPPEYRPEYVTEIVVATDLNGHIDLSRAAFRAYERGDED